MRTDNGYTVEVFVLPRTGDIPLKINAAKLDSASTLDLLTDKNRRWHLLTIYHAVTDDKFVAYVQWRSDWSGELPVDTCLIVDSLIELAEQLKAYDPVQHLIGYPDGAQFKRKQERLEQTIAAQWNAMLSGVFYKLGLSVGL